MASRRNHAFLGRGVDQDTKRELDLLWNQGVKVVREDVKDLKSDLKDLTHSIASMRRWAVGLIVTSVPAFILAVVAVVELTRK